MTDFSKYIKSVYDIIGAAMAVHRELNWGLLEPVYQEALHLELLDRGIENECEREVRIYYKEHQLEKKYRMDVVVGDIILELKSVTKIIPTHRAQLCNYLRLTRMPMGLLINFGEESLICERWAFDNATNRCFIVDRYMDPITDADYYDLLDTEE